MRKLITRAVPMAVALALGFAIVPGVANAQEQQQEKPAKKECTAQVAPEAIEAGQPAVALRATLSDDIGAVTEVAAPEKSGIVLATPEQIQRVEMAREGEEASEPVELSRSGERVTATVWLNTTGASEGTFQLALKSETGKKCHAEVTVQKSEGGGS